MVVGVLCTFMAFMASVYIYGLFSQERMESPLYVMHLNVVVDLLSFKWNVLF